MQEDMLECCKTTRASVIRAIYDLLHSHPWARTALASALRSRASRVSLIHCSTSSTAWMGRVLYDIKYPCRLAIENSRSGIRDANRSARCSIRFLDSFGALVECVVPL